MIRILNIEPRGYAPEARALLAGIGTLGEREISRSELLEAIADAEVLLVRLAHQIDREVIDAGSRLVAIVTATTGLDHIDTDYAEERGVAVLSLRGETEFLRRVSATAEHTWALLLALQRRLVTADAAVKRGSWDRDALRGSELREKRLGILGLGRIGKMIAGYGQVFGMEVAAFDPYAESWADGVKRESSLEELLAQSDVLSVHVPLNRETRDMLGEAELRSLPIEAVLVNTSRGEVINDLALVDALRSRRLAGAALDVIPHERDESLREQGPLLSYARESERLLITPHIGGATHESMARTETFMARKLIDHVQALEVGTKR